MCRSRQLPLDNLATLLTTSLPSFQKEIRFALFPFRSLLMGESQLFSFPTGTKMFQFPAYACLSAFSKENVLVFGNLWFKARMRLAKAYRSLPRPSSRSKPSYPSTSSNIIRFLRNNVVLLLQGLLNFTIRQCLPTCVIEYYLSVTKYHR